VACVRAEKHTHRFRWRSFRERDHVKDLGIDERYNINTDLKEIWWEDVD
jgi:hypothetical protein